MVLPHQGHRSVVGAICAPSGSLFVLVRPSATLRQCLIRDIEALMTQVYEDAPDAGERELELVFGLAGPVGSDLQEVSRTLADALKKGEYLEVEEISISAILRQITARRDLTRVDGTRIELFDTPEEMRISSHMDAGNAFRRLCGSAAAVAAAAIAEVRGRRRRAGGKPSRRAYIIRSLKRPEEVSLLRRVYGPGFFLIGANVNRPTRVESLAKRIARSHRETPASPHYATDLIEA